MTTNVNNITADQVSSMNSNNVSATNNNASTATGSSSINTQGLLTPENVQLYARISAMIMASDSAPPDGLNLNPADDFGVSSDPATAEQQLLGLIEWTSQSGYGKGDCAIVWVAAMIGFNIRLHQWTTPGNPNYISPDDPRYASVVSVQNTLQALTGATAQMKYQGETITVSLSDIIAESLASYALYYAYEKNGGDLGAANQTLLNELDFINTEYAKMNHENPMLDSIVASFNSLQGSGWEDQYVQNGQLINADAGWTNKELATWLSTDMWNWTTEPTNNLRAIEGQCRGDWFMAMVDSGESVIYCILILLMTLMDQYYIDAGAMSAQLDLYTNVTNSYSTMMTDASTTNMTDDQATEMDENAEYVQWQTTYNPRVDAPAAGDAAGQILTITSTGDGTPAENWNTYFNPPADPNSPDYDPNNPTVNTSLQSTEVQQLNTSLNSGATQLTSYSSNLTTQMQIYMQMIQQIAKTMQDLTQKTSDQISYILQKSTGTG